MSLLELQNSPAEFREHLLIGTDSGPAPLKDCVDDWQRADFERLDAGWRRAAGQEIEGPCYSRGWLERGRGHSKTLDIGIMATWCLFASRRRLSLVGAAGDLDQARLLRDAVGRLVYCNPWLGSILEVQNTRIVNARTESTLEIITSDAPTSYGLTADAIIMDEVVHWRRRDLWDSLISSAAKRSTCMVVCITNAGMQDDWQWQVREAVRQDPKWYFSRLDGAVASWIAAEALAEQQRLLPAIAFRRLWLNEWSSGGGDALTPENIAAAFSPGLQPQTEAQRGFVYVAGLDLGVSRDASAVCVLGVRRGHRGHGRIRLAFTRVWRPRKGKKVDLQKVEDALLALHAAFNFKQFNFDPWQATHLASRLQSGGLGKLVRGSNRKPALPMVEVAPTGKNLQTMASVMLEAFNDRRLELYEDADLKRDLTRFRVEERSFGFRLTSPRDATGHGDLGTAFSLAMLAASELAAAKRGTIALMDSTDKYTSDDDSDDDRPPWQRKLDALAQAYGAAARADYEDSQRTGDESLADVNDALFYVSRGARGKLL